MTKEKIAVDKFFTDPAYADEASFMEQAFDYILAKKQAKAAEEAKAKSDAELAAGGGKTFLQEIFDGVTGSK